MINLTVWYLALGTALPEEYGRIWSCGLEKLWKGLIGNSDECLEDQNVERNMDTGGLTQEISEKNKVYNKNGDRVIPAIFWQRIWPPCTCLLRIGFSCPSTQVASVNSRDQVLMQAYNHELPQPPWASAAKIKQNLETLLFGLKTRKSDTKDRK